MPLLDGLNASGVTPGRQRKVAQFFAEHSGLDVEVRACRDAGFSWQQIAGQIHTAFGIRVSTSALSDFIEGRR
jgi:hypothetical protein